jgi:type VI secretion system secreted protein VgrG
MAQPTGLVMKLGTTLGDKLRFRSLSANEEMGRLFDFSVLAVAEPNAGIDPAALLGTNAVVTIEIDKDKKRHFHGLVARAGLESSVGRLIGWRLQLRPWLWLLTRRADSRVFQNMTVEAIIKKVFEKYTGDVVFDLRGSFAPRLYCVQYRETDFNFVSRLMEEEGMYYFFRHAADKHTLVICNGMTTHVDFPGFTKHKYRESQDQLIDLQAITEWRHTHELTPAKVTLTDYDYLKPATSLKVDRSTALSRAPAALEHYDYPGLYTETSRGRDLALVRMQELDAHALRISGYTTTVGALAAGYRFALEEHPLASENTDHVVISTHIDAQYAGYESGQGQSHFSCRFGAMRYAHVFRPDRNTPKPLIPGPQTAVVVGDKKTTTEEIYTDQHGRVKVQFHWDRLGDHGDECSCWVRVASQWAGKAWGMISLPRIGQEVVVDFLEGDPDQPLVTGRVYNAVQVPPYALPDHKTVSTIKSQSSKGGTTANANELRFEDEKGKEYIWFQAERNMRHLVKNSSYTHIKKNENRTIGGKLTESIGGDHHYTLKGKQLNKVGANLETHVGGNCGLNVDGFYQLWSGNAAFETKITSWKANEWHHLVDGPYNLSVKPFSLKADTIAIEAKVKLSLKVGGNFVVVDPSGVSINGTLVNINSGGSADAPTAPDNPDSQTIPDPDGAALPQDPLTPAA